MASTIRSEAVANMLWIIAASEEIFLQAHLFLLLAAVDLREEAKYVRRLRSHVYLQPHANSMEFELKGPPLRSEDCMPNGLQCRVSCCTAQDTDCYNIVYINQDIEMCPPSNEYHPAHLCPSYGYVGSTIAYSNG